jgi:hypothetical protein
MLLPLIALTGCQPSARLGPRQLDPAGELDDQLLSETYLEAVQVAVRVPSGWSIEPLKSSSDHAHQLWISPSGNTAFGVIRFNLPFPVGHRLALRGFLRQMRQDQGQATLLEERWDPDARLLRFVAEGGLYTIRTNLMVNGARGWAVYAGTVRAADINEDELALAERARERAWVGGPAQP